MKNILNRAWIDTWRFLGGYALFAPFVIFAIGLGIQTHQDGWKVAMPEWEKFIIYGMLASFIYFLIVFIINLLAAPYHVEKDRRIAAEAAIPGEWDAEIAPRRPNEEQILGGILNRRQSFTLREAALLMVENRLTGEMSNTASDQLNELRDMMGRNEIERVGNLLPMEVISQKEPFKILHFLQTGRAANSTPPSAAEISRATLYELSIRLELPIPGLKS